MKETKLFEVPREDAPLHAYLRIALTFIAMALFSLPSFGAPKSDLWDRWMRHDPESEATIDHAPWNEFLQTYVSTDSSGLNRVDYAGVAAEDRQKLQSYLSLLQAMRIDEYSRDEQMAYWINLYNALTIEVVLKHMPIASITKIDISPGMFSKGPWDAKLARVGGVELTLNDIEHRILRPIWKDPRIHYAVNCASIGCPNLAAEAFTGERLEEMLDEAARSFVNHPRGMRFERGRLVVSSIFTWYKEDFGGSNRKLIRHLKLYADKETANRLANYRGGVSDEYNWDLNAAVPTQ